MNIGTKIRQLREEKNMTQAALAEYINSTKQTIFKYESGIITNIPMDKIITIAKVLKCNPSYLLGWESNEGGTKKIDNTAEEPYILQLFNLLNVTHQEMVIGLAEEFAKGIGVVLPQRQDGVRKG